MTNFLPSDPGWRELAKVAQEVMARSGVSQSDAETEVLNKLRRRMLPMLKFPPRTIDALEFQKSMHALTLDDLDFSGSRVRARLQTDTPREWKSQPTFDWVPIEIHISSIDQAWPSRIGTGLKSEAKRGAKPKVGPRVTAAMHSDIRAGNLSTQALSDMHEKIMEARYGASRDTVRKARIAVLSEIDRGNSDK